MTLSKPPALATWMLEHLALGIDGDALAGDLLEEFRHRRSIAWYWRQVLMAIFVGFLKELGRQWRAAVFALAWTVGSAIALLYHSTHLRGFLGWPIMHDLFGWAIRLDWPESIVLSIGLETSPQFLMWWFGLGFYLVMMPSSGDNSMPKVAQLQLPAPLTVRSVNVKYSPTAFSARRLARGVLVSLFFGLLAFAFDLSDWG